MSQITPSTVLTTRSTDKSEIMFLLRIPMLFLGVWHLSTRLEEVWREFTEKNAGFFETKHEFMRSQLLVIG